MISHSVYLLGEEQNKLLIKARTPEGPKEMIVNCGMDLYINAMKSYNKGSLMQDAFPFLSPDEREFLINGTLPEEWDEIFSEEEYGSDVDETEESSEDF